MPLSLLSIASTSSIAVSIDSAVLGRRRPAIAVSSLPLFPPRIHQRITATPHRRVFSGIKFVQHSRFPSLTLAFAAKDAESNSNLDPISKDAIACCINSRWREIRFVVIAAACACACLVFVAKGQRTLAVAESVRARVLELKGQFVLPKGLGPKLVQVLQQR